MSRPPVAADFDANAANEPDTEPFTVYSVSADDADVNTTPATVTCNGDATASTIAFRSAYVLTFAFAASVSANFTVAV